MAGFVWPLILCLKEDLPPHDANPACGDAASLAWVDAYMNNTIPEMESDGCCGCLWETEG